MEVKITSNSVRHNKIARKIGDVITVDDADGQRLIKLGVAVSTTAPAVEDSVGPKATEAAVVESNTDSQASIDATASMTRDELAQQLSVMGISFKQNASKEQLLTLFREAKK